MPTPLPHLMLFKGAATPEGRAPFFTSDVLGNAPRLLVGAASFGVPIVIAQIWYTRNRGNMTQLRKQSYGSFLVTAMRKS